MSGEGVTCSNKRGADCTEMGGFCLVGTFFHNRRKDRKGGFGSSLVRR